MGVIFDSYQQSKSPGTAPMVSPTFHSQETGFLEVFPRVSSRPPRLLEQLEAILVDRLRNNDKATSTAPLLTKDRDPGMATNLSLDAHRQTLSAFIGGFSTYTALLTRVQEEFESALDQGLRCTMENVHMRIRIAEEEAKRSRAQGELRSTIMAGELEYRTAAFARLQELKVKMDRAVKRASLAERELATIRQDESRMQALVAKLRHQQANLQALQRQEHEWEALPHSHSMAALKVGALTGGDHEWLEQEYTSTAKPLAVEASGLE